MQNELEYKVTAWWASGRTGLAKSQSAPNAIHFSSSPEFGGVEGRWTPEDLLLASIVGCFTVTFRALAQCENFEYADLEVCIQTALDKSDSGYRLGEFVVRPTLRVLFDENREQGMALLRKTQELCLVSRSLSVPQIFEPHVAMNQTVAFELAP